jgi:hypothetical protein
MGSSITVTVIVIRRSDEEQVVKLPDNEEVRVLVGIVVSEHR